MRIAEELQLIPLVPFALALVAGLFFGYFVPVPSWLSLMLMVVSLLAGLLTEKLRHFRFIPLLFSTLFIGTALITRENNTMTPMLPEGKTALTVVVEDSPKKTEWGYLLSCYVVEGTNDGNRLLAGKKLRCFYSEPKCEPATGMTLTVYGHLRSTTDDEKAGRNATGNFNYGRWLKSHSYVATMTAYGDGVTISMTDMLDELGLLERVEIKAKLLRQRLLDALLKEGLEGEELAVVAAMGFGDKSTLTEDTQDVFSQTGAAHLLALSGMHLGILFVLLSMFVSRLNFLFGLRLDSRFYGQILVIITIWGYVVLVGMPQSVVRSAVMLTLYSAVSTADRPKMSLNALAVTAMIMLLINPMSIWDVGFQMSFMAMVGIFVYLTPIYNIISTEWLFEHPIIRNLWALVCVSLAAQIGTMPLSVYYFRRLPLLFLLTNLIAIPLVTILLYCLFLSLALWAVPFMRAMLLFGVKGATWCLTSALGMMARWDLVSINNISINWIQLMLIYMMIIVVTIMIVKGAHSILK